MSGKSIRREHDFTYRDEFERNLRISHSSNNNTTIEIEEIRYSNAIYEWGEEFSGDLEILVIGFFSDRSRIARLKKQVKIIGLQLLDSFYTKVILKKF